MSFSHSPIDWIQTLFLSIKMCQERQFSDIKTSAHTREFTGIKFESNHCQEKERADKFNCVKKEYFCASDFENVMSDEISSINARNASYYFEAEGNCKSENSVLVSSFEPQFGPSHLDKLKELT